MSTYAETRAEAWTRRASLVGDVDFTLMYMAHDAFNRDMSRLVHAAETGRGLTPPAVATWRSFSRQLHTHHAAEDDALWPRLAAVVTEPGERRILAEMEKEHASLDPRIENIDVALADGDAPALSVQLTALRTGLAAHMVHEEAEALPLLARRLGRAGWDAFGREIRARQGGLKGASQYLPWVLDGARDDMTAAMLRMLPPPARVLYRTMWEPKYRKSDRLR